MLVLKTIHGAEKKLPHMKAFSHFIDKKQKQNFVESAIIKNNKIKQNVNFPVPPILNDF